MRAEARGEAQRVLQVVVAALGKVYAGQFGVRFLIVRDRRDYARVQRADGYHVLQRRAHGVAGEAFHVAHHHFVHAGAEGFLERFDLGRGAAAAGRGVGLVRHEHRVRRHLLFLQAVNILHLLHEVLHHGGHVVGVQPGGVESGVRALGKEQAGQRLHAAGAHEGLVLYHHGHGGSADDKAVAAAVERQGRFGDVLLGGGRARGQEAGHGPFLYLLAGDVVGAYHYHALALARAYPGFGDVDRLGGGGAGRAHVDAGAFGANPLRELAVGYRYHFQQEVLAEGVRVLAGSGLVVREIALQPRAQRGLVRLGGQLVHYLVVNLPQLLGGAARVFMVEVMGHFLDDRLYHGEGRREYHAGLGGHRFGQRPFFGQVAARGGLLVIMDQRQARVLQRQHAGAYGHLERGVQRLGHGMRQAELGLDV